MSAPTTTWSGRTIRRPAAFGNMVSWEQIYGSDEDLSDASSEDVDDGDSDGNRAWGSDPDTEESGDELGAEESSDENPPSEDEDEDDNEPAVKKAKTTAKGNPKQSTRTNKTRTPDKFMTKTKAVAAGKATVPSAPAPQRAQKTSMGPGCTVNPDIGSSGRAEGVPHKNGEINGEMTSSADVAMDADGGGNNMALADDEAQEIAAREEEMTDAGRGVSILHPNLKLRQDASRSASHAPSDGDTLMIKTRPKTKRPRSSSDSDSATHTPRKLAPANKVTSDMRVGMINLLCDASFVSKVNFSLVAAATGVPEQKARRHWREVLSADARTLARDGSWRTKSNGGKGGKATIGTAARKAIWECVAAAYDGAKWAELESECGMGSAKLRRHFREVLKKDVANAIARE